LKHVLQSHFFEHVFVVVSIEIEKLANKKRNMLDFTKFRMFVRIMTLLTTLRLSYPFSMIRPSWHSTTQVSMAAMVKPQVGSIVTVDCETTPDGDFVPEPLLDTHGRLTFVLGGGNYLPGLHDIVLNMKVGDTIENVDLDA
jgi:FKBP-type peptidyl-prolyl cis-trans isomerase